MISTPISWVPSSHKQPVARDKLFRHLQIHTKSFTVATNRADSSFVFFQFRWQLFFFQVPSTVDNVGTN